MRRDSQRCLTLLPKLLTYMTLYMTTAILKKSAIPKEEKVRLLKQLSTISLDRLYSLETT